MLKHENVRDSDQIKVTFVIPHDPAVPKVFVAGDFNKWDPAATRWLNAATARAACPSC